MGCGSTKVSGLPNEGESHPKDTDGSESARLLGAEPEQERRKRDGLTGDGDTQDRAADSAAGMSTSRQVDQPPSPHRTFSASTSTSTGISRIRVTLSTDGSLLEIEREDIDNRDPSDSKDGEADYRDPAGEGADDQRTVDSGSDGETETAAAAVTRGHHHHQSPSTSAASSPATASKSSTKQKSKSKLTRSHHPHPRLQRIDDTSAAGSPGSRSQSRSSFGSTQSLRGSDDSKKQTGASNNSSNNNTTGGHTAVTSDGGTGGVVSSSPSLHTISTTVTPHNKTHTINMQKSRSSGEIRLRSVDHSGRNSPRKSSTLSGRVQNLQSVDSGRDVGGSELVAQPVHGHDGGVIVANDTLGSSEISNHLLTHTGELDDSFNTEDEGIYMNAAGSAETDEFLSESVGRGEASTPDLINICATNVHHQLMRMPKRNFSSPALLQNGVNNSPVSSPKSNKAASKGKSQKQSTQSRPESSKERMSAKSKLLRFSQRTKEQLREFSKKVSGSFSQSSESEPGDTQVKSADAAERSCSHGNDNNGAATRQAEPDCDIGIFTDLQDVVPMPDYVHQEFFNDFGDCFDDDEL